MILVLIAARSQVLGQLPSEVLSTSLHLADFSVVKFSGEYVNTKDCTSGDCWRQGYSSTKEIKFTLFEEFKMNINDYSTMRQLLVQDNGVRDFVTLRAVEELVVYSSHDLSTFLDLRWVIFKKLLSRVSKFGGGFSDAPPRKKRKAAFNAKPPLPCDEDTVTRWLQLCLTCMKKQYCMSWLDYICSMNLINQWLLGLSSEQSLKACILNIGVRNDCTDTIVQAPNLDTLLDYWRESDNNVATAKSVISSSVKLLSGEVFVLQLKIPYSSTCTVVQDGVSKQQQQQQQQQFVFNIFSLQDAVSLALCFKKLGHVHLSGLIARHVWAALLQHQGTYQEQFSPGIFMRVDANVTGSLVLNKHIMRRLAQLRKRLRNLWQVSY